MAKQKDIWADIDSKIAPISPNHLEMIQYFTGGDDPRGLITKHGNVCSSIWYTQTYGRVLPSDILPLECADHLQLLSELEDHYDFYSDKRKLTQANAMQGLKSADLLISYLRGPNPRSWMSAAREVLRRGRGKLGEFVFNKDEPIDDLSPMGLHMIIRQYRPGWPKLEPEKTPSLRVPSGTRLRKEDGKTRVIYERLKGD